MGKTGFEKANEKMFGRFSGGVSIIQPSGEGRMTAEERKRFEDSVAGSADSVPTQVPEQEEPQPEKTRGRGRPRKESSPVNPVFMSFRVEEDFRQKVKELAVERRATIADILYEAFDLLFEKYGVK